MRVETEEQEWLAEVMIHLPDNLLTKLHVRGSGEKLSNKTAHLIGNNFASLQKLEIGSLFIVDNFQDQHLIGLWF